MTKKQRLLLAYCCLAAICSAVFFGVTGSPGLATSGLVDYANRTYEDPVIVEGIEWAKTPSPDRFVVCARFRTGHSASSEYVLDISTGVANESEGYVNVGEQPIVVERWLHGYFVTVPVVDLRQPCGTKESHTGYDAKIGTEQVVRYLDKRDRSAPDFVQLPDGVDAAVYLRNLEIFDSQHYENVTVVSSNSRFVRTNKGPPSNYLIVMLKGAEVRPNATARVFAPATIVLDLITSPIQFIPALAIYIWAAPGMV